MVVDRDAERMRKAEREVGENIPDEMIGLDTEDVGDVDRDDQARGARREARGRPRAEDEVEAED